MFVLWSLAELVERREVLDERMYAFEAPIEMPAADIELRENDIQLGEGNRGGLDTRKVVVSTCSPSMRLKSAAI